ncbi:transcriptional regulatory protein [Paramyrothecium foliicola]|nr:transcriptional regulatory protein [Paramyrothecium foliicola]
MRLSIPTQVAAFILLQFAAAKGNGCCKFSLSSPECFPKRAGQLEDGQIRFNGSYPESTFCLGKDGGITDQNGFGCIVTDAPTTQIQCDHGKVPTPGFSIGSDNLLHYKGSSEFFACPATDSEYNIYVSPNFGQDKCFPMKLKTSGCGAAPSPSCPAASASTVWLTEWATETVSVNVTSIIASVASCPATESSSTPILSTSTWMNTTVPQVDQKRRPASQDHVALLQNRVAWLEGFITRLQSASPGERDFELRTIDFLATCSGSAPATVTANASGSSGRRSANLHVDGDGSMAFHGPTSIYQLIFDEEGASGNDAVVLAPNMTFSNADHVLQHFGIDIDDTIITRLLIIFFKWQYPNFMFVYRDSFLRDHYGEREGSRYWSPSLLLSICALGSLMLPQDDGARFGEQCRDAAESIAMVNDLAHPSITAVQTFLCLAFYEIGLGNLSKGWAFSGIAFRMAQDLGFQKDPETWIPHDESLNAPENTELRRRIYWGCYISDKLISLVLGRSVHLLYNEAEVKELERQPDPPFVIPWRSVGFEDDSSQQYTDISMIPYIKEQIKLARIIERMLSLMSSDPRLHHRLHQHNINSLNLELMEWRKSLPDWADFSIWDVIDKPLKPSITALHLLYNSARISLNFDEAVSSENTDLVIQARDACTVAATEIHSLLRRYRNQYGLRYSPLIMVYAMAQAVRATKAFGAREQTRNLVEGINMAEIPAKATIVVIGAGILGLTIANSLLSELDRSRFDIVIVSREWPTSIPGAPIKHSVDYASMWAGAHVRPIPASTPQLIREAAWLKHTVKVFGEQLLSSPSLGVTKCQGVEFLETPPADYERQTSESFSAESGLENYRKYDQAQLPAGVSLGYEYDTYCINAPVYCANLLRSFVVRGGRAVERNLMSEWEGYSIVPHVILVINASGTGFGDPKTFPTRGQTVLTDSTAATKTVTRQNKDGSWSFVIPRFFDGGTVIGGTKQPGDWRAEPDSSTREKLLAEGSKILQLATGSLPSSGAIRSIADIVGRRPTREGGMRIEVEQPGAGKGARNTGGPVLHAYGAGGRGYEICWGVAEEVAGLARSVLLERRRVARARL